MKTEHDFYRMEINPSIGAVRGLFDKMAKVQLIAEPRLAESFRLPLPDLEANHSFANAVEPAASRPTIA